jgi:hypothetical protein
MLLTRYGVVAGAIALSAAVVLPPSQAFAAGNVSVSVDNDNLVVVGDGNANDITIQDTATGSVYEVTGNNGTTVNGGASVTTDFADRDFDINLGGGDDALEISTSNLVVTITKNLKIADDGGSDTVVLSDLFVGKRVKIDLGDGDNNLTILDSQFTKNAKVATGTGIDLITIDGGAFRGGIDTDDGNDVITITNTGQGKNVLKVKSGDDNDTIEVTNVNYSRKVLVNAGRNDDQVTIEMIDAGRKALINGSTDTDTLIDNGGHGAGPVLQSNFEVFP